MNPGVIYYNYGSSHALRLLVSLRSLRRFYSGPVTILSEGTESHIYCQRIAEGLSAEFIEWSCEIEPGKNRVLLAKTKYHLATPYNPTIALDSDTLIIGPIDELFEEASSGEFCVASFSNWKSSSPAIARRLLSWKTLYPALIEPAVSFGPAINCGVVAFRENSTFYNDWFGLAIRGRKLFIPDEVCCQLNLHRYPHRVVDRKWNCSCKYDDPTKPDTRIVHYHGRKHCRPGLPFHAHKWVEELAAALEANTSGVRRWKALGDPNLQKFRNRYSRYLLPKLC